MKKGKGPGSWLAFIIFLVVVIVLIIGVIIIYLENKKELDCLKPYATDFCYEHNSIYVEHNLIYFYCNNSDYDPRLRNGEVNIFYFIPEEEENCEVGR
jgi:hypothetical protein